MRSISYNVLVVLHTIRVFKEVYIIQALKDFGFTKIYMIVVSHFFSDNSKQSLVFSYVPHYAVVQNKRPRASASVLCKIIVTQTVFCLFLSFTLT